MIGSFLQRIYSTLFSNRKALHRAYSEITNTTDFVVKRSMHIVFSRMVLLPGRNVLIVPVLLFFVLFFDQAGYTQPNSLFQSGKVVHQYPDDEVVSDRAAACAPATALRDMEWNNIDALIETGGSLWQDRAVGRSHYYAPKSGTVSVLFAGALWMGGVSPDQQLKMAAIQYRYDGNDYWAGPLTNDGSAEVNSETCEEWDDFFISYRSDAQRHRQYFECAGDPNCDLEALFPDGYSMPEYFQSYPAHGNLAAGQDFNLAPYYDFDESGDYTPESGDYPWYDFLQEIECGTRTSRDPVPLFGDQTYYWIFNDKGNIHSESGGQPIGMEIRAQAFAFSTNDEVNNMTFYNYVLINQGSQTLTETYFGTWIDLDIGGHLDDYVGCDVQRGLGYGYNGYAVDNPSGLSLGYGENPPAVGVDFFEGPYQDADGIDNPLTTDLIEATDLKGIPYKGIGIGYGDSIVDNERFGMRKFLYHISGTGQNGVPENQVHYYNYLRGYWKNGQRMAYGGNALAPGSGANLDIPADYMFPGDTDPSFFGTNGVAVEPWTEVSSSNVPSDRRFMQSAGPFTLEPGDYNNITVGVVFARAITGNPFASVELVRQADDKAQALFDNCFELVSGPDAPDVTVQEMENEIILMLTNENRLSSNYNEGYALIDPTTPFTTSNGTPLSDDQRKYKFQGYMIYQLVNEDVSNAELSDISKARLIDQCDIKDGVTRIINYYKDAETDQIIPYLMVEGEDAGIRSSFRITEDAFAQGATRLVNHKTYYFMAVAYGYNNYEEYQFETGSGQDLPFLSSRKAVFGTVPVIKAIPHKVNPEAGGTQTQCAYGQELALRSIEGKGNSNVFVELDMESENQILEDGFVNEVQYISGASPVKVKVVDPLRVEAADFDLRLATNNLPLDGDSAIWRLENITTGEVYNSAHSILTINEEIMIGWGLSVTWNHSFPTEKNKLHQVDFIGARLIFEDSSKPWLQGFPDDDSFSEFNWIRSGSNDVSAVDNPAEAVYNDYNDGEYNESAFQNYFTDPEEQYEDVLGGTWAPFCLTSATEFNTELDGWRNLVAPSVKLISHDLSPIQHEYVSNLKGLNNIDVVITPDESKWTRCAVFEMQGLTEISEGNVEKMQMRKHPSVDKNGIASGTIGCNESEATRNGSQPSGMGWFPGYAIDINTGERLNMAFGEDSWLAEDNGRDMIWNPSSRYVTDIGLQAVAGAQHWIYVFKNVQHELNDTDFMPRYDEGQYIYGMRNANGVIATSKLQDIFMSCTWVGSAIMNPEFSWKPASDGLVPGVVRIQIRVNKPFEKYGATQPDIEDYSGATNWWNPRYAFTTKGIESFTQSSSVLTTALSDINVVPNPYYAFSEYETNKLDNRIKITNLPEQCVVSIYNVTGTLVRQFKKADPITSLDWDLKNEKNIPISSGVYIIHINVPGIGEKVLKWFGVMRPVDLDNF